MRAIKVVSISVFGDNDKYLAPLPSFVLAHLNLFPLVDNWGLRVYVDNKLYRSDKYGVFLRGLDVKGLIELCVEEDGAPLCKAMLWRMAPAFDQHVDYTFCRDVDCVPMPRDRHVCELFMNSGCQVHTVHDSLSHTGIMGGLCGFSGEFRRHSRLRSLKDVYAYGDRMGVLWSRHGTDQDVLNALINVPGSLTLLEHRYAGWSGGKPGTVGARAPGSYQCHKAWSMPAPDVGRSELPSRELSAEADRLAAHLGAAGYDHSAAWRFWAEHGKPALHSVVSDCLPDGLTKETHGQ